MNRQLSKSLGRFLRVDPFGGSNDPISPQSLNRYAYLHNDPTNGIDPLGLAGYCPPGSTIVNHPDGTTGCIPPAISNPTLPNWGNTTLIIVIGLIPAIERPEPEPIQYNLSECERRLFETWSIRDRLKLYETREEALDLTEDLPGQHNGFGDAVRHCTWSCLMSRALGEDKAKAEGDAHECIDPGRESKENIMDKWNNGVGLMDAKRKGDCFANCKSDPRLIKNLAEIQDPPGPH